MSPEDQSPSSNDQAREQQLEAEWANVGLCAGMYRPSNGSAHAPALSYHDADPRLLAKVDESEWQPHNRCCL